MVGSGGSAPPPPPASSSTSSSSSPFPSRGGGGGGGGGTESVASEPEVELLSSSSSSVLWLKELNLNFPAQTWQDAGKSTRRDEIPGKPSPVPQSVEITRSNQTCARAERELMEDLAIPWTETFVADANSARVR